jgi:hypothetical protein
LFDALGSGISSGYDICCQFSTTIQQSDLGQRAQELKYTSLVGSFHSHVHNQLCQLSNLATYVEGVGLEDLEGCEQFFSKSNALALSTCYASCFHQQQKIVEYLRHMDTYDIPQNLSMLAMSPPSPH